MSTMKDPEGWPERHRILVENGWEYADKAKGSQGDFLMNYTARVKNAAGESLGFRLSVLASAFDRNGDGCVAAISAYGPGALRPSRGWPLWNDRQEEDLAGTFFATLYRILPVAATTVMREIAIRIVSGTRDVRQLNLDHSLAQAPPMSSSPGSPKPSASPASPMENVLVRAHWVIDHRGVDYTRFKSPTTVFLNGRQYTIELVVNATASISRGLGMARLIEVDGLRREQVAEYTVPLRGVIGTSPWMVVHAAHHWYVREHPHGDLALLAESETPARGVPAWQVWKASGGGSGEKIVPAKSPKRSRSGKLVRSPRMSREEFKRGFSVYEEPQVGDEFLALVEGEDLPRKHTITRVYGWDAKAKAWAVRDERKEIHLLSDRAVRGGRAGRSPLPKRSRSKRKPKSPRG